YGILISKDGYYNVYYIVFNSSFVRSFRVVDFGIFNVVGGLIAMLGFVNNSMAVATQRFMSFAEGEDNMCKKKSIFNISIVLHFFLAIIVGLILLLLLVFFFDYVFNIPSERVYAGKIVFFSLIISTVFSMILFL
ncbi:hypothetical protein DW080_22040, partial [Bacteroides caccae]